MDAPLEIDVVTAAQLLREGALLLDVREPFEFELARVQGSQEIPMRRVPEALDSLPRDRDILVMCHHGGRSLRVTHYLRSQGFERATNIAGGIEAWAQEIDPTVARY